jgi:hypothetical protein
LYRKRALVSIQADTSLVSACTRVQYSYPLVPVQACIHMYLYKACTWIQDLVSACIRLYLYKHVLGYSPCSRYMRIQADTRDFFPHFWSVSQKGPCIRGVLVSGYKKKREKTALVFQKGPCTRTPCIRLYPEILYLYKACIPESPPLRSENNVYSPIMILHPR